MVLLSPRHLMRALERFRERFGVFAWVLFSFHPFLAPRLQFSAADQSIDAVEIVWTTADRSKKQQFQCLHGSTRLHVAPTHAGKGVECKPTGPTRREKPARGEKKPHANVGCFCGFGLFRPLLCCKLPVSFANRALTVACKLD